MKEQRFVERFIWTGSRELYEIALAKVMI